MLYKDMNSNKQSRVRRNTTKSQKQTKENYVIITYLIKRGGKN